MKLLLTLFAALVLVTPAVAQQGEGGMPEGAMPEMGKPAQMDAIAWMHGTWAVDMKYKMDPASDWISSTGTAMSEPILNGCGNRTTFESEVMGMPFKGFDVTTYNRETGQYETMWMDDMSAKMSFMSGQLEGDTMTMTGTDMMQGMEFATKSVAKKISNDELHWSMYMSMDGGETWFENMQMVYKRKM